MESLCWPPSDDVGSGHLVHRYYNRIRGEWSHSIVRCGVYRLTSYREISSCHFLYINRDTLSYRMASTSMKTRLNNHRCDFNNRNREHATTLSSYVWKMKDQDLAPVVKYKIVGRAKAYSPVSGKCRLCTLEKLFIAKSDEMVSLNMRSEISGKCRHRNRHVLSAKLDKG